MFDINPNPDLDEGRQTSIGAATHAEDEVGGLSALAPECRLSEGEARAIVAEVLDATAGWAGITTANGISARQQARFRPMFENRSDALTEFTRNTRGAPQRRARGRRTPSEQGRVRRGTPNGGRFTSTNDGS